jgi:alcohol dehydrogenase (cytochrome c)
MSSKHLPARRTKPVPQFCSARLLPWITGDDVVFAGEISGNFLAFDANDGKVLYSHNVDGPIEGGIVSYASGGKQYVAAISGFVGGYYNHMALENGGGNPAITVFALRP